MYHISRPSQEECFVLASKIYQYDKDKLEECIEYLRSCYELLEHLPKPELVLFPRIKGNKYLGNKENKEIKK